MKKHKIKRLIIVVCMFSLHLLAYGQLKKKTPYPNVGEVLPDYKFYDLVNYSQKNASINDFRGKWLILDFWGYSCTSCIASFPKMDSLAQEFKDSVQLIMVGATKTVPFKGAFSSKKIVKITKDLYAHLDAKWHMKFTTAFDSVLYLKHDVGGLPHILIVDPKGILRYKTMHIEPNQIEKMLKGEAPSFIRSFSRSEPRPNNIYNAKIPLFATGKETNGGNDTSFIFRSLLTKNTDAMPPYRVSNLFTLNNSSVNSGRLEVFNYSLKNLYQLAFFGAENYRSDDDYTKRSLDLFFKNVNTKYKAENISENYCYSLCVPKDKSTPEFLMKSMQLDLEHYFGFKAQVEKRDVPVYYLEIVDSIKARSLISKIDVPMTVNSTYDHQEFVNYPFESFMNVLAALMHIEVPVLNNTRITESITIDIQANMMDNDDIIAKLPNYGLRMVKGVARMDVVVLAEN